MSPRPRLLVTGASGFIGGALGARLLREPQRWSETLFLVRASNASAGRKRLAGVMRRHGVPEADLQRLEESQILCGDLQSVRRWCDDPRIASIERVVSSAAVASFGNHPSIWPVNVDGVLAMARAQQARCRLRQIGRAHV